jgi:hypothetical protein
LAIQQSELAVVALLLNTERVQLDEPIDQLDPRRAAPRRSLILIFSRHKK